MFVYSFETDNLGRRVILIQQMQNPDKFYFNIYLILAFKKKKLRSAYDKFPDFFRMGTFTDSIHMKL